MDLMVAGWLCVVECGCDSLRIWQGSPIDAEKRFRICAREALHRASKHCQQVAQEASAKNWKLPGYESDRSGHNVETRCFNHER